MKFNTTLLAICIVDAWILCEGGKSVGFHMNQAELYCNLAKKW